MLKSPVCKPLHEYACSVAYNFPSFIIQGNAVLGNIPSVLLYLLQVKPFFSLILWLGCVFWFDIHQEADPLSGNKLTAEISPKWGYTWLHGVAPTKIRHSLFVHSLKVMIPTIRVLHWEKMVQNLSLTLAKVINKTTSAREGRHSWLMGGFQLLGSRTLEGMVDISTAGFSSSRCLGSCKQ